MLIELKLEKSARLMYEKSLDGLSKELEKVLKRINEKGGHDKDFESLLKYQKAVEFDKIDTNTPLLQVKKHMLTLFYIYID